MIDWLRRDRQPPSVMLAGQAVPVVLRRHARTRRMTLRLAPDGSEVRITLPQWGRTADAVDFAQARRDWLETQLARIPAAARKKGPALVSWTVRTEAQFATAKVCVDQPVYESEFAPDG